jgi:hypothetical protein
MTCNFYSFHARLANNEKIAYNCTSIVARFTNTYILQILTCKARFTDEHSALAKVMKSPVRPS